MRRLAALFSVAASLLIAGCASDTPNPGGYRASIGRDGTTTVEFAPPQGAQSPTTFEQTPDGVRIVFGEQYNYFRILGALKGAFNSAKMFYGAAILLALLGISIIAVHWTKSVYGFYSLGGSVLMVVLGIFVSGSQPVVTFLMLIGIAIAAVYLVRTYLPSRNGA